MSNLSWVCYESLPFSFEIKNQHLLLPIRWICRQSTKGLEEVFSDLAPLEAYLPNVISQLLSIQNLLVFLSFLWNHRLQLSENLLLKLISYTSSCLTSLQVYTTNWISNLEFFCNHQDQNIVQLVVVNSNEI